MCKTRLAASLYAVIALAAAFCGSSAGAQSPVKGGVTIFTDGLAYPDGEISKGITELAAELDKNSKLRLLPIMGSAGAANVRDLLRFRGADLAVINNDVFASEEIFDLYPEASEKLRYITKLKTQKVVLLARKNINTLDELTGTKILVYGPETIAMRSAVTIFDLLEINAEITHVPDASTDGPAGDAAAIFFFHTDARWLPRDLAKFGEFAPIPVPMTEALSAFYRKAEIQIGELGVYSNSNTIATIQTDTVLASFDWSPRHGRFADVTAFIDDFFAAIPKFRDRGRLAIWEETDPHAEVLGWSQHAYAATAKESVAQPQKQPEAFVVTNKVTENISAQLKLSILSQPPLTNRQSEGGGLLPELAKAALERSSWLAMRGTEIHWDENRGDQANSVVARNAADLVLPWMGGACETTDISDNASASACEDILGSDPLFTVLVAFFSRADNGFAPKSEDDLIGRTICMPAGLEMSLLGEQSQKLVRDGDLTLARPPSLIDCLSQVDRNAADALFVNELEGKFTIAQLGLSDAYHMIEDIVSVQEIRIGIAKNRPATDELLAALNEAIGKLKTEEEYSRIIVKHLTPAPMLGATK
ncbi:MAG: transporter substrate-binding domain-containing protein [Hyphomicrobiales bacterium]|nr:transporter substrate-binding domain-containing protein [Hyphomicrobiales bacterium]